MSLLEMYQPDNASCIGKDIITPDVSGPVARLFLDDVERQDATSRSTLSVNACESDEISVQALGLEALTDFIVQAIRYANHLTSRRMSQTWYSQRPGSSRHQEDLLVISPVRLFSSSRATSSLFNGVTLSFEVSDNAWRELRNGGGHPALPQMDSV